MKLLDTTLDENAMVRRDVRTAVLVWYVKEHGAVKGEEDMMKALQDGPIVFGMAVTD